MRQEDIESLERRMIRNSTLDRKTRRKLLKCSMCPPNKGENAKYKAKHGNKKPKYKRKRDVK